MNPPSENLLHWTLNNSPHDKEPMLREMRDALSRLQGEPLPDRAAANRFRAYRIIPNFNRGFSGEGDPVYSYRIGELRVSEEATDPGSRVRVWQRHGTAGETCCWDYQADEAGRLLPGSRWSLTVEASAKGLYRDYLSAGRWTEEGNLQTQLKNGTPLKLGHHAPGTGTLHVNFSLLTHFPGAGAGLTIFENLERLKPNCRMIELESWTCRLTAQPLPLRGFVLHGEGLEPSTWWVDERGDVVVLATIFSTYLLERRRPGGEAPPEPKVAVAGRDGSRPRRAGRRPNILFINTDQQHWTAMSGLGHPGLRTPAMDALLERGTAFERSYCTDPVCGPARSSWLTGRYTSESGGITNAGKVHADLPDLGGCLREAGYRVHHAGKHHACRDLRLWCDTLYDGSRSIGASGGEFFDQPACRAVADFLDTYDGEDPWFIQLGIVNPHDVCEFLHAHEQNQVPNFEESPLAGKFDLPPLPGNFEVRFRETFMQQATHRLGGEVPINPGIAETAKEWSEPHWRWLAWNYFRYIERADHDLGYVLEALRNSPFAENTIILFSSDHGEAHGHHHNVQKCSLYEEAIRVPFIISQLGEAFPIPRGKIDREHFISGVDLLPTVLDYAGVPLPPGPSGRPLRPLLEEGDTEWREFAYVENMFWARALIGKRWKYVMDYQPGERPTSTPPRMDTHAIGSECLFDLAADPMETENVAENHPDRIAEFRKLLREQEARLDTHPCHPRLESIFERWAQAMQQVEHGIV